MDVKAAGGRIWPVILSGGAGTRLWPLSRSDSPKQLLPLAGPDPMIVTTAARATDRQRFAAPIVVTGRRHAAMVREQLGEDMLMIVEPSARNTAPAIALAALAVAAEDPDGLLLVMPSDHVVTDPAALLAAVARAEATARAGWLVTFGIRATAPETGYGYIRAGDAITDGVHAAAAFIEKPPRERAQAYVASGDHSWNAGIFLFTAAAMRAALAAHAPAILAGAEAALAAATRSPGRIDPEAAAFAATPSESIDYAVFEHAARVAVCPVDPGWSDIGSWDALAELGPVDGEGNLRSGRVETLDTSNCLLRGEGVLLATIGVDNLSIIATPDAVLVSARGRGQDVKTIAGRLTGDAVLVRPVRQTRRFGSEMLVHDGEGLQVRKLVMSAGSRVTLAEGGRVMLLAGDGHLDGMRLEAGTLVGGTVLAAAADTAVLVFDA